MEEITVINESPRWWVILIFIIIIIVILLVIGLAIWESFGSSTCTLGQSCTSCQCGVGLICDRGTCKSPIGSSCSTLTDCVSSATSCMDGKCADIKLSGVGGSPPCQSGLIVENGVCKVPNNGSCRRTSDCIQGSYCNNGKCVSSTVHSSSSKSDSSCSSCGTASTSEPNSNSKSEPNSNSKSESESIYHIKSSKTSRNQNSSINPPISSQSKGSSQSNIQHSSIASIYAKLSKQKVSKFEF